MPPAYHPPVKRSVSIAGHQTSISLEPVFWHLLRAAADNRAVSVNMLVAEIDRERIRAAAPPGLASAVRVWLVADLQREGSGNPAAAAPCAEISPDQ